jgi:O-succinylhomoserine sulfhydrylase
MYREQKGILSPTTCLNLLVLSIATHPASTTHSKLSLADRLEVGITDGLVRLSIGLENVDDIIEDVRLALG